MELDLFSYCIAKPQAVNLDAMRDFKRFLIFNVRIALAEPVAHNCEHYFVSATQPSRACQIELANEQ
jgi:hypothetical protein